MSLGGDGAGFGFTGHGVPLFYLVVCVQAHFTSLSQVTSHSFPVVPRDIPGRGPEHALGHVPMRRGLTSPTELSSRSRRGASASLPWLSGHQR